VVVGCFWKKKKKKKRGYVMVCYVLCYVALAHLLACFCDSAEKRKKKTSKEIVLLIIILIIVIMKN